jgi:hypothetical protein
MPGYERLVGRPFWKNGACWQKYEDGDTGKITTRKIAPGVCKMLGLTGRHGLNGLDPQERDLAVIAALAAGFTLLKFASSP